MPVGKAIGSDMQRSHVAIANRLEKVVIPQNRAIFHGVCLFFLCYVLMGTVIIYIKRTLFHFLARAWNYNKFNVSLWGYLLFCQ